MISNQKPCQILHVFLLKNAIIIYYFLVNLKTTRKTYKARWSTFLPNINLIEVVLYDVKECPIPPDIPNALKLYNGTLAGSRTLYACPPGFSSNGGSPEVVCDGLAWSTTSYSCSGLYTHSWYPLLFQFVLITYQIQNCTFRRGGLVVELSSFMQGIGIRSPVGTDLSRLNR